MKARGVLVAMSMLLFALPIAASADLIPSCVMSSPPRPVAAGVPTRLIWYTENATHATLQDFGDVATQGYRDVTVSKNTLYTLTVWNGGINRTCSALVTVAAPAPTWNGSFYGTPVYAPVYIQSAPVYVPAIQVPTVQTVYTTVQATANATANASVNSYVNTIPAYIPVYETYDAPGVSYGFVPDSYPAPSTGMPFVHVETSYNKANDTTYENHYDCVMGAFGVSQCSDVPLVRYQTSGTSDGIQTVAVDPTGYYDPITVPNNPGYGNDIYPSTPNPRLTAPQSQILDDSTIAPIEQPNSAVSDNTNISGSVFIDTSRLNYGDLQQQLQQQPENSPSFYYTQPQEPDAQSVAPNNNADQSWPPAYNPEPSGPFYSI